MSSLTFHGRTREQAEWVLMTYVGREDYENNGSVQQWIKDSFDFLKALEEDRKWDEAVESKFGADQ